MIRRVPPALLCPLLTALVAASGIALGGCLGDAPHSNPLDPLSEGFRAEGQVEGRVTEAFAPFFGLDGVRVRLVPLAAGLPERATRTDADGAFAFPDVPEGAYRVEAERDGFAAAADTVSVRLAEIASAELRLNGRPAVQAQAVRTVHVDRWFPPEDLYRLEVDATVADPDGPADLARVVLESAALGVLDTLREAEPGRFVGEVDARALPGRALQSLIGVPLHLRAEDRGGVAGVGPDLYVARVIEPIPLTERPQALAVVGATPELVWRPLALPFAATWRIDVVRVDAGVETAVARFDGLPAEQTALRLTAPLAAGDYYWTAAAVDAFGNRSRSKEAGFRVVP